MAVLRAICADGRPVGVLLVETETETPYLVRFLISAEHHRRGLGRGAVELLLAELQREGWTALATSFVPGEAAWADLVGWGFRDTGA